MGDDGDREKGISGFDDGEAHAIERYTSLLDDQSMVFRIKINFYCMRSVIILDNTMYGSGRIDMSRDEVPIDSISVSYTSLDIENIPDFFLPEVGPREALTHRKKCIAFRIPLGNRHTDTIMSNTLPYSKWFLKIIFYHKTPSTERNNTGCGFDNSGEQGVCG